MTKYKVGDYVKFENKHVLTIDKITSVKKDHYFYTEIYRYNKDGKNEKLEKNASSFFTYYEPNSRKLSEDEIKHWKTKLL